MAKKSGVTRSRFNSLVIFCAKMLAKCLSEKFINQLVLEKGGKVVSKATDLKDGTETQVIISKI